MPKRGREYELLVKEICGYLSRAEGLSDVQIQHNVFLFGAAGVKHQIDVLWSFTKNGVPYRVAVECKDYKNHVSKEKIAAFHSILLDIGNIYGILASKMGCQSGAKEYARKYGVHLLEIRHPNDIDWKGRVKNIHADFNMRSIDKVQPHIFVDKASAEELGISFSEGNRFSDNTDHMQISFEKMLTNEGIISENTTLTMQDLMCLLPVRKPGKCYKFGFAFENAVISSGDSKLPIAGIGFDYEIREFVNHIDILGDEVIKAIVKDITEGMDKRIDKFGRVSAR